MLHICIKEEMLSHYWELNIVNRNSNSVWCIFLLSFQFVLMFLSVCEMLGLFPFQKDASPNTAESPNFLPLPYSPALWIYLKKMFFFDGRKFGAVVLSLRQGLMKPRMASDVLCSWRWLWTCQSPCLCLPGASISGLQLLKHTFFSYYFICSEFALQKNNSKIKRDQANQLNIFTLGQRKARSKKLPKFCERDPNNSMHPQTPWKANIVFLYKKTKQNKKTL